MAKKKASSAARAEVKKGQGVYTQRFLDRLKEEEAKWEAGALKERLAPGEFKPQFRTYSGSQKEETKAEFRTGSGEIAVKRGYTPLDVADGDYFRDIGFPGEYPYTRGRDPLGYRAWRWPLSFYSGYGSSESARERYCSLVAAGSTEILLALDLPTQIGYDSDHPMAQGEVGKVGVALDTLGDLERIFEGLPLERIHTGTVGNCIAPWALAMFYCLGEKRGLDPAGMHVWLQNDPFKEYTGRGTYIFPVRVAVDLASDTVEYICKYLPQWEPQYNCVTTVRWGGGSASHEIGFGVANLMAYIEAARAKGISPEELVPRLNLHMTADNDLFEEAAKFRAARRLWAKTAKERLKTEDPRVLALRLSVFTGAHRTTAQEPLNNVIRTTVHVLASILGGVDNIMVPAYDEARALPTLESTRLANLTKHILHDECLVGNTVDPLGGSYYVESLTNRLEEEGRHWFEKVEEMGGAIEAIEKGFYLEEMADGMYRYQREVERGERVIIGVNKFQLEEEVPIHLFTGDPEAERRQIERLEKARRERDNALVERCLGEVRRVAERKATGRDGNVVPAMIEAVRAYVSIGEIFALLREVFGEYQPITAV